MADLLDVSRRIHGWVCITLTMALLSTGCEPEYAESVELRTPVVACGNGVVDTSEACDDGNTVSGDGCQGDCAAVEAGWTCDDGVCEALACGDGIIAGVEECEDGGATAGDGCDASCRLEEGYHCPTVGSACVATVCGDGVAQGLEACDDGNTYTGDGCTPLCTREPYCVSGSCTAVCGDGVIYTGETCDDGNLRSGDGCSPTCTIENGFSCTTISSADRETLTLPVVYRDLIGSNLPGGHPDFNRWNGSIRTGLVESTLAADGYPLRAAVVDSTIDSDASFYA